MMHDCPDGSMRDSLPDFVHGTLPEAERTRVAKHVVECEACAAEVALIEAAVRAFPAPAMDVGRIVAALPRPVQAVRTASGLRRHQWRIAAAVSFIAVGLVSAAVFRNRLSPPSDAAPRTTIGAPARVAPGTSAVVTPPNTASVPRAVRAETARARDGAAAARGGLTIGGSAMLTDDQLQKLLDDLDGLQAVPNAEPDVSRRPIVPIDDDGY
jgi:anti-sigma factor RsiW